MRTFARPAWHRNAVPGRARAGTASGRKTLKHSRSRITGGQNSRSPHSAGSAGSAAAERLLGGATDRAPIKVRKQERGKGKERKGKERKGVIAAKNSYEENGSGHGRGDPVDAAARGRRRLKRPAGCADSLPAGTAAPGCDVSGIGRGLWVCKGSRVRQSPRSPQNSIGSATPDKSCGQRHPYGIRDARGCEVSAPKGSGGAGRISGSKRVCGTCRSSRIRAPNGQRWTQELRGRKNRQRHQEQ